MTCHNQVVTSEAFLAKFFKSVTDVVVNQDRFGCVEDKVWETNPNSLTFGCSLSLNFLCEGLVGCVVARHAMNPNNGNIVS